MKKGTVLCKLKEQANVLPLQLLLRWLVSEMGFDPVPSFRACESHFLLHQARTQVDQARQV